MQRPHSLNCGPRTFTFWTGRERCRAVRFRHHACRLQNPNRSDGIIVGVVEEHRSACAGPGWPALARLRRPIVPEAVLTTAIPSMPIVIVLAVQYHVLEGRASSALFLSVIGSMFTIGVFIALTQ